MNEAFVRGWFVTGWIIFSNVKKSTHGWNNSIRNVKMKLTFNYNRERVILISHQLLAFCNSRGGGGGKCNLFCSSNLQLIQQFYRWNTKTVVLGSSCTGTPLLYVYSAAPKAVTSPWRSKHGTETKFGKKRRVRSSLWSAGAYLVRVVARIDVFSGFHSLDELDVRIAQPDVLSRHLIVHRPPENTPCLIVGLFIAMVIRSKGLSTNLLRHYCPKEGTCHPKNCCTPVPLRNCDCCYQMLTSKPQLKTCRSQMLFTKSLYSWYL